MKGNLKLWILNIILWPLAVYMWISDFPVEFWREPLDKEELMASMSEHYLPLFRSYAEDMDYYFIEEAHVPKWLQVWSSDTECIIVSRPELMPWKSIDVYAIKKPGMTNDEMMPKAEWCLVHEVGHAIDWAEENISESEEFQEAVDLSIEMVKEPPEGECFWCPTVNNISKWPGINGNKLMEDEWGGYSELYAELFKVGYLWQIPPPLQEFYKDYLP